MFFQNSFSFKFFITFLFIIFFLESKISSQTLEDRISDILSKMTLNEKILQLHREGEMNTATNSRLKIPGFIMSDGPHGVRNGLATSFPVGIALAATWDTNLVYRVGIGMGKEFRGKGIHQALGPCLDLTLDPRNGRSPESGGEDPYLNSKINSTVVKGIQSTGEIATIKHFYTEYSQYSRTDNNYIISQRNLMEVHGLQFREAVQIGGAMSVMSAYNLINGKQASESPELLLSVLKDKWGFPGYVVSDWWAVKNAEKGITGGCDLEMGSSFYADPISGIQGLVNSNTVPLYIINESVRRILRTKILSGLLDYYPAGNPSDVNSPENQALCLEAGKKSIVLLKNSENILPLNKNNINKIAVIGPNANVMRTDGRGSSWVDPFYKVSPREGIENYLGSSKVLYAQGCDIASNFSSDYNNAIDYAKLADVVIYFGGLDDTQEGEGWDRTNGSIELPGKQNDLIQLLRKANPNIIVVLISGGICSVNSFVNDVKGLLYAFYPGQEGGNAIAQVLFGDYNPGGKLPVTIPVNDFQLPVKMAVGDRNRNFDNDLGGGYKWFDSKNYLPDFPFGYGLSYTTFGYSNLSISSSSPLAGQIVEVSLDIKNTGNRTGDEVVQLYLSNDQSNFTRPIKQLKSFTRISLEPGETKTVTFQITPNELYFYNETTLRYEVESGAYTVRVGGSSGNLPLSGKFQITSATPKPDLQIANIQMVPPYPLEGDKVIFLATILNRGTGESPVGKTHEVIFSVNSQKVAKSNNFNNFIPAGGMAQACSNTGITNSTNYWVAGKPGTYYISASVNENGFIDETITNNNTKTRLLKVYDSPPMNIALNGEVIVSSTEKNGTEGFYAVDGNLSTRWSSQFSDPQWIVIDLGKKKDFNRLKLYWETAYGKEYSIQVSDDNIFWRTIITQTNGQGGTEQFDVKESARYLKIYGTKRGTQYGYSLFEIEIFNLSGISSVDNSEINLPFNYKLENNYPNPFNPTTTIHYEIPKAGNVKIEVYNSIGQHVVILNDSYQNAGKYSIVWNGHDSSGKVVSSGIYYYRMTADGFTLVKKMVMLK